MMSPFHQALGQMNIAVGAQSVGRVERALLGAIECVGLLAVVEADYICRAEIGRRTSFDPARSIGTGMRGAGQPRSRAALDAGSWRLT